MTFYITSIFEKINFSHYWNYTTKTDFLYLKVLCDVFGKFVDNGQTQYNCILSLRFQKQLKLNGQNKLTEV